MATIWLGEDDLYRRILVPLDGSDVAAAAIPHATAIAKAFGAELTLFHVVPAAGVPRRAATPATPEAAGEVDKYLKSEQERLRKEGVVDVHWVVTVGDPADEIVRYVRERDFDLLVMCTHGRGSSFHWLFGSVASNVMHGVDVPVMVLRGKQS